MLRWQAIGAKGGCKAFCCLNAWPSQTGFDDFQWWDSWRAGCLAKRKLNKEVSFIRLKKYHMLTKNTTGFHCNKGRIYARRVSDTEFGAYTCKAGEKKEEEKKRKRGGSGRRRTRPVMGGVCSRGLFLWIVGSGPSLCNWLRQYSSNRAGRSTAS